LDAIAREKGIDPAGLEVWFGDEARIGQKNKLTRRWAKRGTRPCALQDQRTASTYIFGAICPKEGKGAALVMPWCNTDAMAQHLAAIAGKIEPRRHAVLLLDRTRRKISGNSCATTGCRTGCSPLTTTWSTIAAVPGTSSSTSLGPSCPSDCATGRMGANQQDL